LIGNGCVIAIGGNEEKRATRASILRAFVERAGARDARIVIIPSASIEPQARAERYTRIFTRLGARNVRAVHAERGSITTAECEAIRNATGIFVTGGDQGRLMEVLRASGCADAIREAVYNGAVYAGTSAGASAASGRMIARSIKKKGTELVEFGEGLGLIPDVIIDQHFGQRRRLGRLIHAASEHQLTGVGIDENTSIVWNGDGMMTVEGAGEVTIVDPDRRLNTLTRSYRLHILTDGAQYVAD
jgi:cyanophycinase